MRNLHFLKRSQGTEYLLQDNNYLIGLEPISIVLPLRKKLLQVDLRTFHYDKCIFLFIVLVPFHLGEQIAIVFDKPLAQLG